MRLVQRDSDALVLRKRWRMAKAGERAYFAQIGSDGVAYSLNKPFSAGRDVSGLLHDIAAVYSLLPDNPKLKILDLGCGTGWTSAFFAQSGHDVVGADIAPEAIEAAKAHNQHLDNLEFICSDYDELGNVGEFDVVVFFDSLHHSENEMDGLLAAYRALKPGGKIILCEPGNGHSKSSWSIEAVQKYGVNERDMPPKLSTKQLKRAGFADVRVYAYPAKAHRALYYQGSGNKAVRLLRSNAFMRGVAVMMLTTFLRSGHGIVEAVKPAKVAA